MSASPTSRTLMVNWGFAFRKGFAIWLWSILWNIVGFIIVLVVTGGALLSVLSNPNAFASNPAATIVTLILGFVISSIFTSVAVNATIVKIAVEASQQQMPGPMPPRQP